MQQQCFCTDVVAMINCRAIQKRFGRQPCLVLNGLLYAPRTVFPRVTTLIWLDISDEECISNLLQRGQADGGTEEQFEELLEYTRGYRLRKNHLNSFDAHERFFEVHPLHKLKLCSRSEVGAFLEAFVGRGEMAP
ncbi:hypothetical protein ACI2KT_34100 [Ensifer adhaerens]|uniref:hypothetical protein n=1 Tax=Ensifer adhaerens TaxID=106592 RepID=UPI0038511AC8